MLDSIPLPEPYGVVEYLSVNNLNPDQTYYIRMKAYDDAGNASHLSNLVEVSTSPVPITDLNAFWGNFHGDLQNTGRTNQNGPTLDSLLWSFETSGWVNSSPSIDDLGNVFFGSDDGIFYCLSALGQVLWSQDIGDAIVSSPLISTLNRVYVSSKNNTITSLNKSDGSILWTFNTSGEIQGSPIIFNDGDLIVGDLSGILYNIDSESGSLNWQISVGNRIYSTPSFSHSGESLYIGGFDKKIYAINPINGNIQWEYNTGGYILSSVAVDSQGNIYATSSDRKIYSLDSQGVERWVYETNGALWYSSPAIGYDGGVYFGSDDNHLYSINTSNGSLRWVYETNGDIRNSPVLSNNGDIYFGSTDNTLYHLNTDGILESSVVLGGQVQRSSVGMGISGMVIVGSLDNKVYAYGIGDTIPPVTPEAINGTAGENSIELSWNASDDLDLKRYVIYRNQNPDLIILESDSIAFISKEENSFVDTSVLNGESYNYAIRSVDISNNRGELSNTVTFIPIDLPPGKLNSLQLIEGNYSILLTWSVGNENDLAGHKIYSGDNQDFIANTSSLLVDLPLPINSYNDEDLILGQGYYYVIAPYDEQNNVGLLSEIISGTPKD